MDNLQLIGNLVKVLSEELKLYRYILDLSKGKTDIIINGDIDKLSNITDEENKFVIRIGKLEELREKIVYGLSKSMGIDYNKLNISKILQDIDSATAKNIEKLKSEIKNVMNEFKDINDLNGKLLKNSLDIVNFSINLISNVSDVSNNYSKSGQMDSARKKTYFDAKY